MKELSDDIMIKRIREAVEQYEPDYSPQFWEKIRKQRPVPEFWLITLLQKYKFWPLVLTITGVLFITFMATDIRPSDKNSAVDMLSLDALSYSVSGKVKEITSSENTSASGNIISSGSAGQERINISTEAVPARITDPRPSAISEYIPVEDAIEVRPGSIEKSTGIPVLSDGADFGYHFRPQHLIPVEYRVEDIQLLKGQADDRSSKAEFHWPDLKSLIKEEDYDKFLGPNKLTFFYSPEIHYSDSIKTIGVSQGIGITFEGPIRSLISVSAGLSYQSISFNDKTVFSGLVPPTGPWQPSDTNSTFYYIDSIAIRCGSYKFLEVPVSLNFRFLETTRSQVWFGAGISSIAFLRQEYTYETFVEGISKSSSSKSIKAWENIHPVGSLNFGLLYRYKFGERFLLHGSLQYKHHLAKLGYNSMKLNRLNLQIGLAYRFGRED